MEVSFYISATVNYMLKIIFASNVMLLFYTIYNTIYKNWSRKQGEKTYQDFKIFLLIF